MSGSGIVSGGSSVIEVVRAKPSAFSLGVHKLEVWRDGQVIRTLGLAKNTTLNAALDDMNNVYLRNGTPKAAWYMGLIDASGFTTLAVTDTASSHAGWTENTGITGGVRPTWSPAASSGQAVVNGTQVSFTVGASAVSIKGVFVISDSTLGGSTGLMLCTSLFVEGTQALNPGDILKDTYTFSLVAG